MGEVRSDPAGFRSPDGRADLTNILGTSVGMREVNGGLTEEWAITVYVRKKLAPGDVASGLIPSHFGGFATDVVEVGEIFPQYGFGNFEQPARCGSSCGHFNVSAGTIGAVCIHENRRMLLSNNHILANLNSARVTTRIARVAAADCVFVPAELFPYANESVDAVRFLPRAALGVAEDRQS